MKKNQLEARQSLNAKAIPGAFKKQISSEKTGIRASALMFRWLLAALFLHFCILADAQNTLNHLGLTAATPSSVAFSLRKLSSTYTGPVMRIRKSSDGELRDVYFNGSGVLASNSAVSAAGGGTATTTSLATWIGNSSGTVAIWYDQSGHGRNIDAAVANQPLIVQSGSILTGNGGKPRVQFNGSTFLTNSSFVPTTQPISISAVWKFSSLDNNGGEICGWGNNSDAGSRLGAWIERVDAAKGRFGMEARIPYIYGGTLVDVDRWNVTNQVVASNTLSSTTQRLNGVSQAMTEYQATTLNISTSNSEFAMGTIPAARTQGLNGSIQELIVFPSALSGNERIAQENNQLAYYNITVPVTLRSIRAWQQQQQNDIKVEWTVANQLNISRYVVEKSTDGRNFSSAATVAATGNARAEITYGWLDVRAVQGTNYYRIKSVDADGAFSYSSVVKVLIGKSAPAVSVYPNPVVGGQMNLNFSDMKAGAYQVRLLNILGQIASVNMISHSGGSSNQLIAMPAKTGVGTYILEVIAPDGARFRQQINLK
jgi:hypothetical protein